ncbi:hypothetical protein [Marinithermus hydrothermalis]|nr:hypothetical protein [Marinithermus hydrothermalis]
MRRAGDEFFSPATLGLVGGIIGEYALERGLFTVGRGVFGDSSQGLDARQVLARQLARLAIGITGAAIAVSAKEEAEKAVGVGMMGESIISLLKGAGVSFGG